MFNLKTKTVFTVEQIHAEVDAAEDKILKECNDLLTSLNITTEANLIRKSAMMKELGFVNSETVKQAETFINTKTITEEKANLIKYFKQKYPLEKFITIDEFDRICAKYNLIYAPAVNYIKDIPEKNVLDMTNCKKLESGDRSDVEIELVGLKSDYLLKLFNKNKPIFKKDDLNRINGMSFNMMLQYFEAGNDTWAYCAVKYGVDDKPAIEYVKSEYYSFNKTIKTDKSGLFIAAPKSHFNLDNLSKQSEFGFFKVKVQEVKDPIAFEFVKGDIVRIITKWGTDDDKSYLDPSLIFENNN
jgi:hypothetical protein